MFIKEIIFNTPFYKGGTTGMFLGFSFLTFFLSMIEKIAHSTINEITSTGQSNQKIYLEENIPIEEKTH